MPQVVAAVRAHKGSYNKYGVGPAPVFLDGGVRRGTDVIKALGLGATAVLVGKPFFFSLAVAGEQGVGRMFEIFRYVVKRERMQACVRAR